MNLLEVKVQENYRLFVRFDDGSSGVVDLSEFVGKGVFVAWETPSVFEQVSLAEAGHPEWPGGLDLCPDFLYMRLTGKRPEQVERQLPPRARGLVIEWATIHQEELRQAFQKAASLEHPAEIAPLD